MIQFRSSDILFSRIKDLLSSYSLTGLLDEGNFFDWVKVMLMKLNLPAFNQKEIILEVIDKTADLPEDFHLLWSVWACDKFEHRTSPRDEYQGSIVFTQEDICFDRDNQCATLEPVANKVIRRNFYMKDLVESTTYNNTRLLKLVNQHVNCSSDCLNLRINSNEEFTMSDKMLKFNFKAGNVVLQYFAFALDENGLPLIPDDVRIEEALEAFITYKVFQKGYYNNIGDLEKRMIISKMDYEQKYLEAERHLNIPEYKTMVEYAKRRANRWKAIEPEQRISTNNAWWIKPTLEAQGNFLRSHVRINSNNY